MDEVKIISGNVGDRKVWECPACGNWNTASPLASPGDIVSCDECGELFEIEPVPSE